MNPTNHKGSFLPMGNSIESARTYELGISAIWSKDLFISITKLLTQKVICLSGFIQKSFV